MKIASSRILLVGAIVLGLSGCSKQAEEADASPATGATASDATATVAESRYPERVLWGDEHVHSGWSMDAGVAGASLTPEDAVRFARGDEVKSNTGQAAKLARPLDWIAVTDHSDGMGTISELKAGHPDFMADPRTKKWSEMMQQGEAQAMLAVQDLVKAQATQTMPPVMKDEKWVSAAWHKTVDIMEKYNAPGTFTTFIAYEWTSNGVSGENLHRNVIFRDNGDKTRGISPLTTWDNSDPASLWAWLANYEKTTGGKVLAIPHNGNLSNGRMFEEQQYDGKPLTREWVEARARFEPLIEYFQIKGQSEANPKLSPNDEFANFEVWDTGNLVGKPKIPDMIKSEYAREALKSGLRLQNTYGTNPFKIGAAGGTDTHNALPAADENNWWGKVAGSEPKAQRWNQVFMKEAKGVRKDWTLSAAGYTGVWATANTRTAIWDAMKRRETYASSGPRMTVRFFGGYDFAEADAKAESLVATGYARGVPMGGDLKGAEGKVPTFLISAMKDPAGANLDRVQVIKGWVDVSGKTHEAIFEVVWSDPESRQLVNGKVPPVGNTVDVATATYKDTIGAPELIGVFKDPQFDPKQRAFYYVRVLEIPTPRWTAYDSVKYQEKMSAEVPMTLQERAITSPIWYEPM